MTKIEYEFDEPDHIMELEPDTPFGETIPILKDKDREIVTFKQFLYSFNKQLLSWDGKPVMATKKLKTKCYFLTKDWMVYEVRFTQQK